MINQLFPPWNHNCVDALEQVFFINAAIVMAIATYQVMM